MQNHTTMAGSDFIDGDKCPVHGTPHRKVYTFGSGMTTETDVCTFRGCKCAVVLRHDCCGVLQFDPIYCTDFDTASGYGVLRREDARARFSRRTIA